MAARIPIEQVRKQFYSPMSEEQIRLLRDVQAFIDEAIESGLSFPTAVGVISHDMNNIARFGFNLEEARQACFRPQVSGYADPAENVVGEVREDPD